MFVVNVNRRWSESSLPRSQVSDLYSSLGSFLACLMSADTTAGYPYWPPSRASRSGYDVRPRSRYSCSSTRTGDRLPNGQAPPDLQPLPVADGGLPRALLNFVKRSLP